MAGQIGDQIGQRENAAEMRQQMVDQMENKMCQNSDDGQKSLAKNRNKYSVGQRMADQEEGDQMGPTANDAWCWWPTPMENPW